MNEELNGFYDPVEKVFFFFIQTFLGNRLYKTKVSNFAFKLLSFFN